MDNPLSHPSAFRRHGLAWLAIVLLAGWFGGMGWGIDAALRKFERHTTATPPQVDSGES